MKSVVFFNNKGGVGKTSLVYHLAWMYADLGLSVVAVDLDPQANLSAMFLPEDRLDELWPEGDHPDSVLGAVGPILRGIVTLPSRTSNPSPSASGWSWVTWGCRDSRRSSQPPGRAA